ncbi:MAG: isocitrate lyase/PEP mutase family protein [Nocardioidaceae bacterium]
MTATALRTAIADLPLLLPGAADALTARILEDTGFAAVYATGAGFANAAYAWPDLGLLGMSEVVEHAGAMAAAVDIPVVVDADTGYGGPLNVARTVRALERHGVAGVQIEDQVSPKRCGHFAGTEVVDEAELVGRITAAVRARENSGTVVIGRTDATATLGLDTAIARGRMLADAGADVVFVEAPRTVDDLARIPAEIDAPTLVNVVEGGATPQLPLQEYADMGFSVVLYANTAMRLAAQAVRTGAAVLRRDGDSLRLADRILPWEERQRLVRRDEHEELAAQLELQSGETRSPDGSPVHHEEARSR